MGARRDAGRGEGTHEVLELRVVVAAAGELPREEQPLGPVLGGYALVDHVLLGVTVLLDREGALRVRFRVGDQHLGRLAARGALPHSEVQACR